MSRLYSMCCSAAGMKSQSTGPRGCRDMVKSGAGPRHPTRCMAQEGWSAGMSNHSRSNSDCTVCEREQGRPPDSLPTVMLAGVRCVSWSRPALAQPHSFPHLSPASQARWMCTFHLTGCATAISPHVRCDVEAQAGLWRESKASAKRRILSAGDNVSTVQYVSLTRG